MYSNGYQSNINIMQVHSSAVATFCRCCLHDALALEFDIMLISPARLARKSFSEYDDAGNRVVCSFYFYESNCFLHLKTIPLFHFKSIPL